MAMRRGTKRLFAWVAVLAGCAGVGAFGAGFQLYNEGSAEALALGGAISARRDMISNAWYNPASITEFKSPRLMLGGTLVQMGTEYEDGTGYGDSDGDLQQHWQFVPHAYYIHPLCDCASTTFFLSITTPYGLATDWDWGKNVWGPMFVQEIALRTTYITGGVAVAVNEHLSLAGGLNLVNANVQYRAKLLNLIPPHAAPEFEMSADAWGWGYVLAANLKPHEDWTAGIRFQSPVQLKFQGDVSYDPAPPFLGGFDDDVEAEVTLPATVNIGVATTAVPRWTFSADVVWTDWSQYDQFKVKFDSPPASIPGFAKSYDPLLSVKNWRDTFGYRVGAEYLLTEAWKLRFGYVFDESPVRDEYRSPELPCSDRHMFSLGVGYARANWGVDLAYTYLLMEESESQQNIDLTQLGLGKTGLRGNYENGFAHLIGASVWFKF
jgi:long-chain fatty acid transport protein